jgi:protein-S-isoprenylcysteine O-methyltransferase Ste14
MIFRSLHPSTQESIMQKISAIHVEEILPQVYTTRLSFLGAIIWIVGTRIRLAAFATLGRFFRFDISIQRTHKLVTTGPYAYVRHPSYTGLLLTNIGWACYHFSRGSWLRESGVLESSAGKLLASVYLGLGLLPTMFVTLGRLRREEDMLRTAFGKEWEEWARQVPSKIIPGVY